MSNKIKIYRYIGLKKQPKTDIPNSNDVNIAFNNRKTNRYILMLSDHGIEDPNCQCVLVEYKDFDHVGELPFKAHLPDGSKWFVANEINPIGSLRISATHTHAIMPEMFRDTPTANVAFIIFQKPGVRP